jgi:hypothetical protein
MEPPSGNSGLHKPQKAMQRVIDFRLEVQGYVRLVGELGIGGLRVPEGARRCPFCEDGHWMRGHGSYGRFATGKDTAERTRVRRLYCKRTGRTVSLLALCLAPRKQHSFGVIGDYLEGRVVWGLSQRRAMERATKVNPSRQKGSYWEQCLIRGRSKAEVYLGSGRRHSSRGGLVASYIHRVQQGFKTLGQGLAIHNRRIHEQLGVWLL